MAEDQAVSCGLRVMTWPKPNHWQDAGNSLTCPRQSGNQPILNIDPETGEIYVEDHSNYRLKQHGRVFRLDQEGNVLKTWPSVYFNDRGFQATSPWWLPDFQRHFRYPDESRFIDSIFGKDGRIYRWRLTKDGVELLRFDREGNPLPFSATGTHVLTVDYPMQVNFWHDVFQGMDVDRAGNIYYVAKADVDPQARPVSAYNSVSRQINVYSADGTLKTRGLLRLDAVRGIQVDESGDLYVLHRPAERPWDFYLAISKFPARGGEAIWSRRWDGYIGQSQVIFAPCHCILSRQHQTLDGKGYLFAAGLHSVQIIDTTTGRLVGEFGSYGNFDCQGPGSAVPASRTSVRDHLGPGGLEGSTLYRRRAESADRQVPHSLRSEIQMRRRVDADQKQWSIAGETRGLGLGV